MALRKTILKIKDENGINNELQLELNKYRSMINFEHFTEDVIANYFAVVAAGIFVAEFGRKKNFELFDKISEDKWRKKPLALFDLENTQKPYSKVLYNAWEKIRKPFPASHRDNRGHTYCEQIVLYCINTAKRNEQEWNKVKNFNKVSFLIADYAIIDQFMQNFIDTYIAVSSKYYYRLVICNFKLEIMYATAILEIPKNKILKNIFIYRYWIDMYDYHNQFITHYLILSFTQFRGCKTYCHFCFQILRPKMKHICKLNLFALDYISLGNRRSSITADDNKVKLENIQRQMACLNQQILVIQNEEKEITERKIQEEADRYRKIMKKF